VDGDSGGGTWRGGNSWGVGLGDANCVEAVFGMGVLVGSVVFGIVASGAGVFDGEIY